jgi:hypothetical protein
MRKRGERRIHLQERKGRGDGFTETSRGAAEKEGERISAALTDRLRKERSQRVGPGQIGVGGFGAAAAVPCDSGCPLALFVCLSVCL